jgi:hypothetical protein
MDGETTHSFAFRSSFSLYVSSTRLPGGICVARNRTSCTAAHLLCCSDRDGPRGAPQPAAAVPSRAEEANEDRSAVLSGRIVAVKETRVSLPGFSGPGGGGLDGLLDDAGGLKVCGNWPGASKGSAAVGLAGERAGDERSPMGLGDGCGVCACLSWLRQPQTHPLPVPAP